jgi:hypothetical protein
MFKMFSNSIIKSFIPAALMLMLLTVVGCFDYDNVLAPDELESQVLGELKSDQEVLAAPTDALLVKHAAGVIGPAGGEITVPGCATAIFPAGALEHDTYITIAVEVDHYNSKVHYVFGPHGTWFKAPVRLEMPWGILNNYDGPNDLWYLLDDVDDKKLDRTITALGYSDYDMDVDGSIWVIENTTTDESTSCFIVYVDHFSEYYYPRR